MILIAEDILINQKVIQAVLRMNNYEATIVENGAEAVDYFQNTKPELILMDISMPVMNGYDATREIRLIEKKFELHTPIIAVTAHGTTKDKELCIQSGMDSIIFEANRARRSVKSHQRLVSRSHETTPKRSTNTSRLVSR